MSEALPQHPVGRALYVTAMPTTLSWPDHDGHPASVLGAWTAFAETWLSWRLARLAASDVDRAEHLSRSLAALPTRRRQDVTLAPQVTAASLPGRAQHAAALADVLEVVLRAEHLRDGHGPGDLTAPVATARGDLVLNPDGTRIEAVRVPGLPPADLDSPHARTVDLTGAALTTKPRPPMLSVDRDLTTQRLYDAAALLESIGGTLPWFVRTFTLNLVVQSDRSDTRFSSGSHGYFVGRTVLANVHRPGLRPADVVDAMVHESIHSLLYMQEDQEGWFLDPELLHSPTTICSPWTGNPLPLRPYLQACFVWYGLVHLWARAMPVAPLDDARRLMLRAAHGFLESPLTDRVRAVQSGIEPALLDTIQQMQDRICCAVREPA